MNSKIMTLALVAMAGTTVALAAPRESADLVALNGGPINSVTRVGGAGNQVFTVNFAGNDGGGSYAAKYLTFNATIGQSFGISWTREACILITPPGGTPFIFELSSANTATVPVSATNAFCVPVSTFSTAGEWRFEFFDYYDDVTTGDMIDAKWTACTVTLEDGPVPAPAIGPGPSMTFFNTPVDGSQAAPSATLAWNNATAGSYNAIRLSGVSTGGSTDGAAQYNPVTGTNGLTPDLRIAMTPPGGGTPVVIAPVLATATSSTVFDISVGFAGPAVGNWSFGIFDVQNNAVPNDSWMNSLTVELVTVPPPAATTPITLINGTTVSNTQAYGASTVVWYTFTLPADVTAAANRALEIDTEGSAATNPSMGLYDGTGTRIATDFDDGSGTQAQLTFGVDGRPAVGTGLVYNGRDGSLLTAGNTYYLAVMSSNGTYGPAVWSLTPGAGASANVTTNFRYFDPSSTIPTATNLGTLVPNTTATASAPVAAGQIAWFKFSLANGLSNADNRGLRIDNEGSTTSTANNTSMGLYSSSGAVLFTDTVDGTDSIASLSFGYDNGAAPGNGVAYNGRDGFNVPAGDYYVAVGAGDTGVVFNGAFFASSTSTVTGTVNCNVKLVEPGITPATPPADVTDLGNVGDNVVATATFNLAGPDEIKWVKFTTSQAIAANNTYFLDIDTEGSALTGPGTAPNDTEVALYTSFGGKIAEDDDDGTGPLSAISIGNAANPRPALGDGAAYNGRDGAALGAGTFYAAAGCFNMTFNNAFGATHAAAAQTNGSTGPLSINVRSNLPVPPSQCSVADVGMAGGEPGQDNLLDNNDFIAFINFFFDQNPIADMGVAGGEPGSDGFYDNNDFIAFINHFFEDVANCTG